MFRNGRLDLDRLRALVDFHVSEGSDGIVVAGTTGEAPALSTEEHMLLTRVVVEQASGRIPIIASTGANSTSEAIELTASARNLGVDAVLSIVPYYNKPTQDGLYRHFKAIAEVVDVPIILYNVPKRTGCDLGNATVRRLALIPNIVGIKDATGDMERGCDLLLTRPDGFAVYSGDDATALALMLLGGDGTISVAANVAPKAIHELCRAALAGDLANARRINKALFPLYRMLFVEANPIPVKWAAARLGLIEDGIRLPLTPLSPIYHDTMIAALRDAPAGRLKVAGETVLKKGLSWQSVNLTPDRR
jgi:4-hydroxy-tetrahydrodipicolinate synthase